MNAPLDLRPDCAFPLARHNGSIDKKTRWIWNMLLIELDSQILGKWVSEKKNPKSPKFLTVMRSQ